MAKDQKFISELTEQNSNGQILFKYKIALETNHTNMLMLEENLENKLQQLPNKFLKNALKNLPKKDIHELSKISCQNQKYAFIKKYFTTFFCEQEREIELPLTPTGDQFYNFESENLYQEFVTEYCNIIAFLKDIICKLELKSKVQLTASSVIKANDADQKEVNGPQFKPIPIF